MQIIRNFVILWCTTALQMSTANNMPGIRQPIKLLAKMTTQELMTKSKGETRAPQVPGINFTAYATNIDGFFSSPPDTMGDVGPTQYILDINFRIRTFNKATGFFDGVLDVTLEQFFGAGVALSPDPEGRLVSDPRIRYDRMTDRWFLTTIGFNGTLSNVFIAMSDTGIITNCTTWCFFALTSPLGADTLPDYPTLGLDQYALYIGTNDFTTDEGELLSAVAYVVNKESLICGNEPFVTSFILADLFPTLTLFTPQGAVNFDTTPTFGFFIVGQFPTSILPASLFVLRINDPETPTPSLSLLPSFAPDSYLPATLFIPVLDSSFINATNVGRPQMAVVRDGNLWTTQGILMDSTGNSTSFADADRIGCRWYELTNLDTIPTVAQSGNLVDTITPSSPPFNPDATQYFYPSVMVSGQSHMALGCTQASALLYLSAVTCGRLATDPLDTLQTPTVYANSSTGYNLGDRWGDYSYIGLDPSDDMTMWCIQEWCNTTDSYGCQVVQLKAPPPATPSSTSPVTVPVSISTPVTVFGTQVNGSGFYNFCPDSTPCPTAPGQNPLSYLNPTAFWVKQMKVTVTNGSLGGTVSVISATYVSPTQVDLVLDTSGASSGEVFDVTITNPDGQSKTGVGILTITP